MASPEDEAITFVSPKLQPYITDAGVSITLHSTDKRTKPKLQACAVIAFTQEELKCLEANDTHDSHRYTFAFPQEDLKCEEIQAIYREFYHLRRYFCTQILIKVTRQTTSPSGHTMLFTEPRHTGQQVPTKKECQDKYPDLMLTPLPGVLFEGFL